MFTRRAFLMSAAVAAAAGQQTPPVSKLVSKRPAAADRKFTSDAVEATIRDVKRRIADPELAWLFENCFPNTLDTTVRTATLDGRPDTFVVTGDIDAMWLRDSTAQVWPYLPLAKDDTKLRAMLAGVVNRQARCVLLDPYANAFNFGPTGSEWEKDRTRMRPELHERKWEIDSLCYVVRLAYGYWKTTGDASCFDTTWQDAGALIVKTFREQQRKPGRGPYSFQRNTTNPTDSLPLDGFGNPSRPCGLIHSGFRPSDDACIFPFLVPSNLFAAASLKHLEEIASAVGNRALADECRALSAEVAPSLAEHARVRHPKYGEIYAYEVDGFGNSLMMDDANVPNLLGLPYLGCCQANDPLYRRTRAFSLSEDNPYFCKGTAGEGLGSPHSGLGTVWPIGIIMRALTSEDAAEIAACLKLLKATHAGTGFMHESFQCNDAARFTRKWFAWANTLFGEMVLRTGTAYPEVLAR
jgi:meiotically up-regulated gene 157 (Mug157) protein